MEVNNLIKTRKSIRTYDQRSIVTDDQIRILLEAAMLAPSACNQRPWEFIVVQNREMLHKIMEIHRYSSMLKSANNAIFVTVNLNCKNDISDGFYPQDCGAAIENILLQAVDLGLGTCWCGIHPANMEKFKTLFNLPSNVAPFAIIAVGVPAEQSGSRGFYEESKVKWIK